MITSETQWTRDFPAEQVTPICTSCMSIIRLCSIRAHSFVEPSDSMYCTVAMTVQGCVHKKIIEKESHAIARVKVYTDHHVYTDKRAFLDNLNKGIHTSTHAAGAAASQCCGVCSGVPSGHGVLSTAAPGEAPEVHDAGAAWRSPCRSPTHLLSPRLHPHSPAAHGSRC